MIKALYSLSGHLRIWVVMTFACLTICSGLCSARANVITVVHLMQGEQVLPDGGWTSACNPRVETCVTYDVVEGANDLYGLHHHHHADCQFNALPALPVSPVVTPMPERSRLPGYAAVIKAAGLTSPDQPPKI